MITESTFAPSAARLRQSGQRVTAQRLLLLRLLEESDGHLNADELYRRAREEMPDINLSTVYRNLQALEATGLVDRRYFSRDHSREYYEMPSSPEHYHFTCKGCGAVSEFETPLIEQVRQDLQRTHGVTLRHACMCFEGYCAECSTTPH